MGTPASPRSRAPLWLALVATAIGIGLAFLLKEPCTRGAWGPPGKFEYRRLCYNDLQPLFHVRGISQGLVPYRDVEVEYPVITGMFMDVSGRVLRWVAESKPLGIEVANSDPDYFRLSALLLAPFAFAITVKLRRRVTAGRLMLWAVGPPIILYAFHNWDLLAVAGAVWGLVEAERSQFASAGAGLGLGASAKLFPAFLVPGALLQRWQERDRRGALLLFAGFLLGAAAANVPWIILAPEGWLATWTFHADRYPDFGSVWFWIAEHGKDFVPTSWWEPGQSGYRDLVNVASLVLFAGGALAFLGRGWVRGRSAGRYPLAATGLGILAVFLLVSKVHSPQYALWVLPFLVLLNVPRGIVAAYFLTDLAVFVSGFYWFTVFEFPGTGWGGIFEAAVWLRAISLGLLAWWATRAERLEPEA
ncbi:MAG: glycosyltransferase 87 family protein [Actinomycetota bacterium]